MSRKKANFTLPESMIESLKSMSEETMIPQARIVEKAVQTLLDAHKKEMKGE